MMHVQFIGPESDLWGECLAGMPHDFYHLPGYLQLCAESEGGSAQAFLADDGQNRLFLPLIVRPLDRPGSADRMLRDATSPYGYPSPLLAGAQSQERRAAFLDRALKLLLATLRECRVVSLYLRLHPLLPLLREPFCRQGTLVRHGETVFVDLTQSEEEWWRQTPRSTGVRSTAPRGSGMRRPPGRPFSGSANTCGACSIPPKCTAWSRSASRRSNWRRPCWSWSG